MRTKVVALLLFLVLALLASSSRAGAQDQELDVAVVVNESNRVSTITLTDLRKVFAGERHWWAVGVPIKLVVRAQGTHEQMVLLKLLGLSESEYKQYWIALVFRGEVDSEPMILPSVGMQMEALTVFAGGITMVSMRDVKPGMKVLRVNGRVPGEEGYPLH